MIDPQEFREAPWDACSWRGMTGTIGGLSDKSIPTAKDVADVLFYFETPDGWDGDVWALVRLRDGRLCAWQSWWGPTGSGFCEDAYGGDAVVYFSNEADMEALLNSAWDERGRELYRHQLVQGV